MNPLQRRKIFRKFYISQNGIWLRISKCFHSYLPKDITSSRERANERNCISFSKVLENIETMEKLTKVVRSQPHL